MYFIISIYYSSSDPNIFTRVFFWMETREELQVLECSKQHFFSFGTHVSRMDPILSAYFCHKPLERALWSMCLNIWNLDGFLFRSIKHYSHKYQLHHDCGKFDIIHVTMSGNWNGSLCRLFTVIAIIKFEISNLKFYS